jgi:hypothetical protein
MFDSLLNFFQLIIRQNNWTGYQIYVRKFAIYQFMEHHLDILLERFLFTYPNAQGVTFHSMDLPIEKENGSYTDVLKKYKDIPMMSIDDKYNTSFSFIITDKGSIVIFFLKKLHFVSVYVKNEEPNKELAQRMYEQFKDDFEGVIQRIYETTTIH